MKKAAEGDSCFRLVVGANLKRLRKKHRLKGAELGMMAGYNNPDVAKNWTSKIERGTFDITLFQAANICSELDAGLDELMDGYDRNEAEAGIIPLCPTDEEKDFVYGLRRIGAKGRRRLLQYMAELEVVYPVTETEEDLE